MNSYNVRLSSGQWQGGIYTELVRKERMTSAVLKEDGYS